jgi:glycosyltransferase involved in cell wall biosynthesis
VFVSHYATIGGGAQLALLELLDALRADPSLDLQVICPGPGALVTKLEGLGVGVAFSRCPGWSDPPGGVRTKVRRALRSATAVAELSLLLRRLRPDVVITNCLAVGVGAVAAKVVGAPHVWLAHEFPQSGGLRFELRPNLTMKLVNRLSARVLAVSRVQQTEITQWVPTEKVCLLQQSVDVPALAADPPQPAEFTLALVGRKTRGKGQHDAVRAVALLRDEGCRVRLALVGSGVPSYVAELERLVAELDLSDAVDFVDETDDPYTCVAQAHVALMCSGIDTFGRTTIEAMKLGTPVIGARAGGTAELIADGQTGLLYEPGSPEDLAAKIKLLSTDANLRYGLAANALAWAQSSFTRQGFAASFTEAIQDLLPGRCGAA